MLPALDHAGIAFPMSLAAPALIHSHLVALVRTVRHPFAEFILEVFPVGAFAQPPREKRAFGHVVEIAHFVALVGPQGKEFAEARAPVVAVEAGEEQRAPGEVRFVALVGT